MLGLGGSVVGERVFKGRGVATNLAVQGRQRKGEVKVLQCGRAPVHVLGPARS